MALSQPHPSMSETEYLAFERANEIKHEFVAGTVKAMTGASWRHNVICANITGALLQQFVGTPCTVVAGDMRVKVNSAYRYPDVVVVCGEPDFTDDAQDTLTNPVVLVEVLSPSTALIDRNEKLHEYQQIASLQAYLLVSQNTPRIERYLRQDAQNWLYTEVNDLEADLDLPANARTLSLQAAYTNVRFESD